MLNCWLVTHCTNTLNQDQEFSAPKVVSYLMNWGDHYISNTYVVLYWDSMVYHLKNIFPELCKKMYHQVVGAYDSTSDIQELGQSRTGNLRPVHGKLELCDQKDEYIW
ncbi:hypothetical protein BDN71DRAFT_1433451 [Pleurotus eryngii]|uniref:Uncharacterized protein n=1 Tax=Pleurotus eryngii TaxID=5323 RepID=A0A9P5ZR55_PLEER|nr:hypothetical protein BDN71DRAFT_1433451 [Pleurotus eryngii]